jgi:hypothetical protein
MNQYEPRHKDQDATAAERRQRRQHPHSPARHAAERQHHQLRTRIRRIGSVAIEKIVGDWDRFDTRATISVVGISAVGLAGVYLWEEAHQEGYTGVNHDYYVHMKVHRPGETITQMVERYGQHHSRWTVRHADKIVANLMSTAPPLVREDGLYQDAIFDPDEVLAPGLKVEFVRRLLEKPTQ